MKKNANIIKLIIVVLLSLAMVTGLALAVSAGEETWDISFDKVSGNSALGVRSMDVGNVVGYRAMQGIGFDTYTEEDGYVFMQSDDEKTFILSHFKMDEDGFCLKVSKRTYQSANLGHANDLTIYKDTNGTKWIIFAPCGTYSEDNISVATDKTELDLGAIKLDEAGNPMEDVYSCDVSAVQSYFAGNDNKGNITGITYMGKKYIDDVERQVFLVMNAKEIYETYVTQSGDKLIFTPTYTSGRINKPTLPSGTEADTQGIVYHNRYIYITGEGKGTKAAEMAVARISLDTLFDGNRYTCKDMEVYKADMKTDKVTKHGPEGAFFTSLNGKSNLYIGINRQVTGIGDDDEIDRTPMRF